MFGWVNLHGYFALRHSGVASVQFDTYRIGNRYPYLPSLEPPYRRILPSVFEGWRATSSASLFPNTTLSLISHIGETPLGKTRGNLFQELSLLCNETRSRAALLLPLYAVRVSDTSAT